MLEKLLRDSGQFLTLSRTKPELFEQPVEFKLDNGIKVSISAAGIICFEPEQCGDHDIILSCGVHGNETAPIEICDGYVESILAGNMALTHRVLFLFGNLPAMDIAQRFTEENMNRLFSGAHSEGKGLINDERRRAKQLEQAVTDFYEEGNKYGVRQRSHYDLHTAIRGSKNEKFAVYPYRHGKPWKEAQLQLMLACGVNTILLSGSATTTFSYYSSNNYDADAFTVELGMVRPFGENDMSRFEQVNNTLARLMTGQDLQLKDYDEGDFYIYQVNQIVDKTKEDFKLNFADDALNFTDYPLGFVLAEETGKQYKVEHEGEAIVFPNANVALGQRALLTVIPTKLNG